MQREERFNDADRIIKIGFWVNAVLMAMKLAAGYWGRSEAVFADGIESACDFVAILSTMIALRIGRKPFDADHPYGHGRAESLAAMVVSFVIFATGIWILINSVQTLMEGDFKTPSLVAVAAAVVTIGVKEALFRFTKKHGDRLGSPSILALAKDHRKDALTSISTLIGVAGAFVGFGFLDPLAAGLTSFFILHIGFETFKDASHDLMDGTVPGDYIDTVKKLAESVQRVEHVHDIRCRRSGQYIIIDLKLDMDPGMTVKESHDVGVQVKKLIFEHDPNVGDVMIHVNPHDEEHEHLTRL